MSFTLDGVQGKPGVGRRGSPGVAQLCAARLRCVPTLDVSVRVEAAVRSG